jgi:16S rRNA (guanine527-N7)-methyltransferase
MVNPSELLRQYFPEITSEVGDKLLRLPDLYAEWNARINVVSRKDMDDFFEHHVLHSLALAYFVKPQAGWRILDVGTGGGFPGIPLAICFPDTQFVLVDSIAKKIKVVQEVAATLELKNVDARAARAEQIQGPFDLVVSRAVTRLAGFYPWVKGKIRLNGMDGRGMAFLKGGDLQEEMDEFLAAYPKCRIESKSIFEKIDRPFFETKKLLLLT